MSENYWKDRYKETWDSASKRESATQEYIQRETGLQLENSGLGTGSSEYLSGSAASHGYSKGGADFRILGTNIEVEVTGDLTGKVDASQDIWIRPDKIQDAINNPAIEKWVVHHLAKDQTVRAISLNEDFLDRYSKGGFKIVRPKIRGTVETYVALPASDKAVQPMSGFVDRLRNIKNHSNAQG